MIEEQQLAKWERLANEATEGPWECCESKDAEYAVLSGNTKKNAVGICYSPRKKDIRFCAAARKAVPQLIAKVRRFVKLSSEYFALAEQYDAEADWLAEYISGNFCPVDKIPCKNWCERDKNKCVKCWREDARKAVQDAT